MMPVAPVMPTTMRCVGPLATPDLRFVMPTTRRHAGDRNWMARADALHTRTGNLKSYNGTTEGRSFVQVYGGYCQKPYRRPDTLARDSVREFRATNAGPW